MTIRDALLILINNEFRLTHTQQTSWVFRKDDNQCFIPRTARLSAKIKQDNAAYGVLTNLLTNQNTK